MSTLRSIEGFRNVIPDSLDLDEYAEVERKQTVRPAGYYRQRVKDSIFRKGEGVGLEMPWLSLRGKVKLRPGELSVWTGYKGHGKSLMLSQVMLHGMVEGERPLILSPEFRAEMVLERKLRQSRGAILTEQYADEWFAWANQSLWLFDHQGTIDVRTVLSVLRYAREKFGITQAVVDSLMKCGIAPDDFQAQKSFVDALQTFAHDTGCHVHLVAHARKGGSDTKDHKPAEGHDVKGTSEICDMAENVFSVWKNKRKLQAKSVDNPERDGEPDALLLVDAQRNGDWTGMLKLRFQPCGQYTDSLASDAYTYFGDES